MSTKPQNSALDRICGRSDGFNKHECRAKAVSHTEFARRIVYRMLKPGTGQPIDAPSRITVGFCGWRRLACKFRNGVPPPLRNNPWLSPIVTIGDRPGFHHLESKGSQKAVMVAVFKCRFKSH